jgi:hypothetical protein
VDRPLGERLDDGGWNCETENGSVRTSFDTTINVLEGLLEFERMTGGSAAVTMAPGASSIPRNRQTSSLIVTYTNRVDGSVASRPSAGHAPAKVNSRPCASSWVNTSTIAGPYTSEYRWELLGEDRGSVVENDAQRPPIGRKHLVRKLRRALDVCG